MAARTLSLNDIRKEDYEPPTLARVDEALDELAHAPQTELVREYAVLARHMGSHDTAEALLICEVVLAAANAYRRIRTE